MIYKGFIKKLLSATIVVTIVAALMPAAVIAAPAVSTLEPTDITSTSATLRGAYNDQYNENIIYGVFVLRETDTGQLNGEYQVSCNSSTNTATLPRSGLKAGTRYTVEFYVNYGTGITMKTSGGEYTFTTLGSTNDPNANVSTPSLSTYDSNSVNASSSYYFGSNVHVTETGFVYSGTESTPEIGRYNCQTITANTSSPFSTLISGLNYNSTYYVRAYVKYYNSAIMGGNVSTAYSNTATYNGGTSYGVPTLQTVSASFQNGQIMARGTITGAGNSGITERGFVYSQYNNTPTLSDYRWSVTTSSTDFTDYFTPTSTTSSTNTYYVRAYAINANGTGYGEVRTTNVNYNLPTVSTLEVLNVTGFSADVRTNVTSNNNYSITERGVVYSKTNATPEVYGTDSHNKIPSSGSSNTGELTIKLNELDQNTRYYVRAYARNVNGVAYGEIRDFTTPRDNSVTTVAATGIKGTSATVGGKINSDNGYTILERGVVYSKTVESPTLDDNKVADPHTSQGSFDVQLLNLTADSKYYYRAFMRTTQGTSYGEVMTLTTTGGYVATVIEYKTGDAKVISTQTIDCTNIDFLTVADLTPPAGYTIVDSSWRHEVKGTAAVVVLVKAGSGVTPGGERAFMESTGNMTFSPNRQITRVEIAKMIYALLGNGETSPSSSYSDVPAGYYAKDAIDFCTANRYMQGYPEDRSFRPERTITRAEIAVVLNTVYKLTGNGFDDKFSDISRHWGRSYINIAAANNIITGYPDGTFKPEATTTRAEACVLFSNASHRSLQPLGTSQFVDVQSSHWAYTYIMNAATP